MPGRSIRNRVALRFVAGAPWLGTNGHPPEMARAAPFLPSAFKKNLNTCQSGGDKKGGCQKKKKIEREQEKKTLKSLGNG